MKLLLTWVFTCFLLLIGSTVVQAAPPATSPSADFPKRLYDRVMQEFVHKDYEAALAGFRFFLELYGRSPLAASAQYWIGECEFRLGRYEDALRSFEKAIERYPSSPKLASATFKKALTYEKIGRNTESRILLERVVVQFPDTQEAALAKKALQQP